MRSFSGLPPMPGNTPMGMPSSELEPGQVGRYMVVYVDTSSRQPAADPYPVFAEAVKAYVLRCSEVNPSVALVDVNENRVLAEYHGQK